MRYVLGVDGGQTATTAIIADEEGSLLGVGYGGPANHVHEPGGAERARRSVSDAIRGALTMADLENAHITSACLGIPGSLETMRAVCEPIVPADRLVFGEDTRIALYSVTYGNPGVVVVSGTGAAAYGVNALGEKVSVGGWGYLMGDEGGGYWIALRALNACCRAYDGIAPPTQILPMLLQHLELVDIHQVHREVYSCNLARRDVAGVSEVVGRAAAAGDPTACRILREAGHELASIVTACITQLGLQKDPVTVGTVGGVFRSGRFVLRSFREAVKRVAPFATIVPGAVPPAVGATLMALEDIGISVGGGTLGNVHATLSRLGPLKT